MKYKLVLFDLDGTLFDFNGSSMMALKEVFFELGLEDDEETYNEYFKINDYVWKQLQEGQITAIELKSLRWKRFLDKFDLNYNPLELNQFYLSSLVDHTVVIPGVEKVLEALYGNVRLAAVTNGLEQVQKARLKISKLEKYFEQIIISEEIGVAKPQGAYFDHTFKVCNNPAKSEVILIGDGLSSDIKGAYDFGIESIWFNPQKNINNNIFHPTFEIENLHDAVEIIIIV